MPGIFERLIERMLDSISRFIGQYLLPLTAITGAIVVENLPPGSEAREYLERLLVWLGKKAADVKKQIDADIRRFRIGLRVLVISTFLGAILALLVGGTFDSRHVKAPIVCLIFGVLSLIYLLVWWRNLRGILTAAGAVGLTLKSKQLLIFLKGINESAIDFGTQTGPNFGPVIATVDDIMKRAEIALKAGANIVLEIVVGSYQQPGKILPWFGLGMVFLAFLPYGTTDIHQLVFWFNLMALGMLLWGLTSWKAERRRPIERWNLRLTGWILAILTPLFLLVPDTFYWINKLQYVTAWGLEFEKLIPLLYLLAFLTSLWSGIEVIFLLPADKEAKRNEAATRLLRGFYLAGLALWFYLLAFGEAHDMRDSIGKILQAGIYLGAVYAAYLLFVRHQVGLALGAFLGVMVLTGFVIGSVAILDWQESLRDRGTVKVQTQPIWIPPGGGTAAAQPLPPSPVAPDTTLGAAPQPWTKETVVMHVMPNQGSKKLFAHGRTKFPPGTQIVMTRHTGYWVNWDPRGFFLGLRPRFPQYPQLGIVDDSKGITGPTPREFSRRNLDRYPAPDVMIGLPLVITEHGAAVIPLEPERYAFELPSGGEVKVMCNLPWQWDLPGRLAEYTAGNAWLEHAIGGWSVGFTVTIPPRVM